MELYGELEDGLKQAQDRQRGGVLLNMGRSGQVLADSPEGGASGFAGNQAGKKGESKTDSAGWAGGWTCLEGIQKPAPRRVNPKIPAGHSWRLSRERQVPRFWYRRRNEGACG